MNCSSRIPMKIKNGISESTECASGSIDIIFTVAETLYPSSLREGPYHPCGGPADTEGFLEGSAVCSCRWSGASATIQIHRQGTAGCRIATKAPDHGHSPSRGTFPLHSSRGAILCPAVHFVHFLKDFLSVHLSPHNPLAPSSVPGFKLSL